MFQSPPTSLNAAHRDVPAFSAFFRSSSARFCALKNTLQIVYIDRLSTQTCLQISQKFIYIISIHVHLSISLYIYLDRSISTPPFWHETWHLVEPGEAPAFSAFFWASRRACSCSAFCCSRSNFSCAWGVTRNSIPGIPGMPKRRTSPTKQMKQMNQANKAESKEVYKL